MRRRMRNKNVVYFNFGLGLFLAVVAFAAIVFMSGWLYSAMTSVPGKIAWFTTNTSAMAKTVVNDNISIVLFEFFGIFALLLWLLFKLNDMWKVISK